MIVITTPTGQVGRAVLDQLIEAGAPLRVIARNPERLAESVRAHVTVVTGSHDDPEVLSEALIGADSLFWVVPPNGTAADADAHYEAFTRALVRSLADRPVRVVAVSSLGRGFTGNAGLLTPAWAMEEAIEATGVPLRTLRLPFFMENVLNQVELIRSQGMWAMANSPGRVLESVATRDAADLAAELLLDRSWTGQEGVPLVGDALTPNEMADTMFEVLGRRVRLMEITPAHLRSMVVERGASEGWAKGIADTVIAQNDGVYSVEHVDDRRGAHTSFREWCELVLKPAVTA